MPDYSVSFANLQHLVRKLEEPFKTELADIASDLQSQLDADLMQAEADFERAENRIEKLSKRISELESDKRFWQNNSHDAEQKLSDLEYERDRQVRDLESKVSDLEREQESLKHRLRQAEDQAHRAQNPYY